MQRALSKGGMGAIYLAADHETFDRLVVIKAMLDYFDPSDRNAVQAAKVRFLQEARTLSTLRHPAIPQIYGYFADGPHNYIVMEYIEGTDLEQGLTREDDATGKLVAGGPYHTKDVIRWAITLCKVLDYLANRQPHAVVHHDIKPANLLLDGGSDEVRLVDFGTARARLLMQPGVEVGLHKSSVFGTQGYAPPEQYGGQSEPRSDVYALAATLYHLLSDDDPRSHPFDFPEIKRMGTLGKSLAPALLHDVRQRASALMLRRQLEALLAPSRVTPIQAPDGEMLTNEQELAIWLEQHWADGATWLYDNDKLSEQVARFWAKNKLAADLRKLVRSNPNDMNVGLDSVLGYLDPHGFGIAPPKLQPDRGAIDFGILPADGQAHEFIDIVNNGRRHLHFRLQTPQWITPSQSSFSLRPAHVVSITLTADMQRVGIGGRLRDTIILRDEGLTLARIEVQAAISRWRTLWRRVTQPMTQASLPSSPEPNASVQQARPSTQPLARVAVASRPEAQRRLKTPPPRAPGTIVIRNRGGVAAWFTKEERRKLERSLGRLGVQFVVEPLDVQCWNEFRVICTERSKAVAAMGILTDINEKKRGITQLDLEILSGP